MRKLTTFLPLLTFLSITVLHPSAVAAVSTSDDVGSSFFSSRSSNDSQTISNVTAITTTRPTTSPVDMSYVGWCPSKVGCVDLGASCIQCKLNYYCTYGSIEEAECMAKPNVTCQGTQPFTKKYQCRYCYQLERESYSCDTSPMASSCTMKKAPPEVFYAKCVVKEDTLCLGDRTFYRKFTCSWTQGYKWSTALALSVTLGGFGVDRFYLGMWREGLGKLFSFGGLGVWTIVDVILIAVGYIGPHDSSLFIYPWD